MNSFFSAFYSRISEVQRATLNQFLDYARQGKIPLTESDIRARFNRVGTQLSKVHDTPTDPEVFNQAMADIIVDLASVYAELDNVSESTKSMGQLMGSELDRIGAVVNGLETQLEQGRGVVASPFPYTHVVYETFGAKNLFDHNPKYYTGAPEAWIDPSDHSLRLEPVSSFSRTITKSGAALVNVEILNMLGRSVEGRYPVKNVVDGTMDGFWQEVFHAYQPIMADQSVASWLPTTYEGGAAVRLHFEFERPTPISDVVISLAARFPVQLLQVAWDNPSVSPTGMLSNPGFEGTPAGWVIYPSGGAPSSLGATGWVCLTGRYSASGFYLNAPARLTYAGSTEWTGVPVSIWSPSGSLSGSFSTTGTMAGCYYTLEFDAMRSSRNIIPEAAIQWMQAASEEPVILSTRQNGLRVAIDHTPGQWKHYTITAPPPPDAAWVRAFFTTAAHSGNLWLDNVELYRSASFINLNTESQSVLTTPLTNCECENLYITLAQKNYTQKSYEVPRSAVSTYRIWGEAVTQVKDDVVYDTSEMFSSIDASELPAGTLTSVPLRDEIMRLGGSYQSVASEIEGLASVDPADRVRISALEYQIGVREVDLLFRENRENGLYVSKPVDVRGEVRELRIIPDIREYTLAPIYRVLLREADELNDARAFSSSNRVRIFSADDLEVGVLTSSDDIIVPPVRRVETYEGTDWSGRLYLDEYPYLNNGKVFRLTKQLSTGTPFGYNATPYDPNAESLLYYGLNGLEAAGGYRPLKVSLKFANGKTAMPDNVGRPDVGDIGYAGSEGVSLTMDYLTLTSSVSESQTKGNSFADVRKQAQSSKGQEESRTSEVFTFTTRYKPILSGPNGAMITAYWSPPASTGPTQSDVLISPTFLDVNPQLGIVRVLSPPPSADMVVWASYYYQIRTGIPTGVALPVSGMVTSGFIPASYPFTRNMTDYVTGKQPSLSRYNDNPLDPNYYPVYDYYQASDGALVFTEDLSPYGDTPARIQVEYETLALKPRLVIELWRYGDATKTPVIDGYTLLVSARKVPDEETL